MDLLTMLAGLAAMALFGMVLVITDMARRKRAKNNPRFKPSTKTPVVEREITQKVRGRRSARPVLRNTQLRGKPRRKF